MGDAERYARLFHDTYERLAPEHGWETQERSRVGWDDLPPENRALMVAVVAGVLAPLTAERDALAERSAFLNRNCWNLSRDELIAKITAVSSPEWQAGVWIDAQIDPHRKRAEAAEAEAARLREAPGPDTAAGRWPWPVTVKAFVWPDHTSWRYEIIESDIDTYGNASSWAEVVERVDNLAAPPGEPTEGGAR